MRFEETLEVSAPRAAAWDFLWQIDRLAACLPGCKDVREVEAGKLFKASFEDSIGPYKVRFDMDITVQESRAPEFVRLSATGRDTHLGTSQQAALDVSLGERDGNRTAVTIAGDVQVLGKVATLGQFVIKRKVSQLSKQFAANLAAALEGSAMRSNA